MIKRYLYIVCAFCGLNALADATPVYDPLYKQLNLDKRITTQTCDTVVNVGGYPVRVIKQNNTLRHLGLNLFADEAKKSADPELLNFIESALLIKSQNIETDNSEKRSLIQGRLTDFRNINPGVPCRINTIDNKTMTVEWSLNGKRVSVSIPIGYDTAHSGTRGEIEDQFISKVKGPRLERIPFKEIDNGDLEPKDDEIYVVHDGTYLNKEISRDTYFHDGYEPVPVWDAAFPLESFANLILYPSELYGDKNLQVSVLKHEYGEKEMFTTRLDQFIAACEQDGCLPFWGVEKFENGTLEGVIFLYNEKKAYDHVLKITCTPEDVINGNGTIQARASLFIPTNNVHNLYAPYVKKSESEKINFEGKEKFIYHAK